ncbi:MAG: FMN-binding protein [Anaerovoracaceae bacterium]
MKTETKLEKKEIIMPSLVLVIICLVVTALLAATYSVTKPNITANEKAVEEKAKLAVLPDGEGEAYKTAVKSYGGTLSAMVGINPKGEICGVTVISHSDTPGLGTKAMDKEYLKQYNGLTELKADSIKKDPQVDAISGATISSNAVYQSVKDALEQNKNSGGATNE